MATGNDLIDTRKRILRILEYCRRHAIHFTARSTEPVPVEMSLLLSQIAPVPIDSMGSFEDRPNRELGLVTKVRSFSYDPELPLPSSIFSISFQYRTIGHSFHSLLVRFIPCARTAVFSMPRGIYAHRLRQEVRFPILPTDLIQIQANSHVMDVINVSFQGVAAVSRGRAAFRRGQVLQDLLLTFSGRSLRGTGTVRHVTKISEDNYLYGISLEFPSPDDLVVMREYIARRQRILSDSLYTSPH